MNQEVKNQHYIPQFYLRKFGKSGKSSKKTINVFNKKTLISSEKIIKKTASKDNFYDIEKDFLENYSEEDKQIFEKYFGILETKAAEIFNKIEKEVTNTITDKINFIRGDKELLSIFLEAQYIRTEFVRNNIFKIYEQSSNELMELYAEKNEELKKIKEKYCLKIKIDEIGKRFLHLKFMVDNYKKSNLKEYFFNRQWFFIKNNTKISFYTSDNPINLIRIKYNVWGIGPATADIIVFPLTPKILLLMYSKNYLNNINKLFEPEIYYMKNIFNKQDVLYYNLLQIDNAYEEVYSLENNFKEIMINKV